MGIREWPDKGIGLSFLREGVTTPRIKQGVWFFTLVSRHRKDEHLIFYDSIGIIASCSLYVGVRSRRLNNLAPLSNRAIP